MPYHHGSLPASLVAQTRRLLRVRPAAELSIREVARGLGVSANAPYRHFPDRAALFRAVAADGYRTAAATLADQSEPAAVAEVWQRLAENEAALVGVMTDPLLAVTDDPVLREAIAEWLGEVARAVEGSVPEGDAETVIRGAVGCWAAVVGLTRLRDCGLLAGVDQWMVPEGRDLARLVVRRS